MFNVERKSELLKYINKNGNISVSDAAHIFNVTEETIRRDLNKLENQGLILRTHGGAVTVTDSKSEYSLEVREGINIKGKSAIACKAASIVRDGDVIMLDASTSSLYLAKHLKSKRNLTIITNALKIVLELAKCNNIAIILTGGILKESSMSFVGNAAERMLENYYADKVFFSCKGFLPDKGLMDSNEQDAQIKRIMLKRSRQSIFLCDSTKYGNSGFEIITQLSGINTIVTEDSMPEELLKHISSKGVSVIFSGGQND